MCAQLWHCTFCYFVCRNDVSPETKSMAEVFVPHAKLAFVQRRKKRKKEDGPASQPHDDRFTFYNTDTHKMRAIRNPTPNYLVHVLLLIEYRETSDSSCKLACSTGKLTSGKMMHNLLDQILDLVLFCLLFQIMILTILKKYSDWHTCRQMHSFKFSKNNLFFFLFLFVVKFIMNV